MLNSKNDESEQNTTCSGDEDDFLSELIKEYESDNTVGKSLENEKLAKQNVPLQIKRDKSQRPA